MSSYWDPQLTLNAFVCAAIAAFVVNLWEVLHHGGAEGKVIWRTSGACSAFKAESYKVFELPIFIAIGLGCGLLGALFNHVNRRITLLRRRAFQQRPKLRVLEVLIIIWLVRAPCEPTPRRPRRRSTQRRALRSTRPCAPRPTAVRSTQRRALRPTRPCAPRPTTSHGVRTAPRSIGLVTRGVRAANWSSLGRRWETRQWRSVGERRDRSCVPAPPRARPAAGGLCVLLAAGVDASLPWRAQHYQPALPHEALAAVPSRPFHGRPPAQRRRQRGYHRRRE